MKVYCNECKYFNKLTWWKFWEAFDTCFPKKHGGNYKSRTYTEELYCSGQNSYNDCEYFEEKINGRDK